MEIPEGAVIEILLRLPLKSLYVCKCVSKWWCSIISDIEKLHHARNLGIFVSNFGCSSFNYLFQSKLTLNNISPTHFIKQLVGGADEYAEIGLTQVINGLFCTYTPAGRTGVLTLCNCYTSEIRDIPLPRFSRWTRKIQFYFGIDRLGIYKLLSLGFLADHVIYQQVLTLGGMNKFNGDIITTRSWMNMFSPDFIPDSDVMCKPSICIDGILYWLIQFKEMSHRKILAFSLSRYQFYYISLPAQMVVAAATMVNFMGRFTVGCLDSGSNILNLWRLNKRHRWNKHSINLPEELVRCNRNMWCSFGNLPTGEILLANPKANDNDNDNDDSSFIPIYSYHHSTRKFQRFVVGKLTSCLLEKSSVQISCVELNSSCHSMSLEALLLKQPISVLSEEELSFEEEEMTLEEEKMTRGLKHFRTPQISKLLRLFKNVNTYVSDSSKEV
ncbi:F-box protein At5g65850-like isoform X1 [Solanum lycopersicum]|nr:F-box protein At5g65850-like isoform X1 [Solanum lycopersicum]XP_010312557.1 F-box protein At5g65850-like isoform X1 [Solanum lycopersicum]XP_025884066.1 F-box protein At5g65850-like isoform X1 [Solanum lycopersicum]XP_025884067.1 F-box protein At5g65850-like isoform X1 [Solanum lycopersicum]XP_025884068.1 F-box protein At5g65850-like isoform X1 [Solanum lycopersicum]XP_025884069.1 F-box protein At5g65850-like isoform X1 [Solanum lycopersicum]